MAESGVRYRTLGCSRTRLKYRSSMSCVAIHPGFLGMAYIPEQNIIGIVVLKRPRSSEVATRTGPSRSSPGARNLDSRAADPLLRSGIEHDTAEERLSQA